jgi:hypothetical protein
MATYTATIIPFVHFCDKHAAEMIHTNMKFGGKANCLGATCADVVGIWDATAQRPEIFRASSFL